MGSGGNRSKTVFLESKDENDESVETSFDDAREISESVIPIQYSSIIGCAKGFISSKLCYAIIA